MPRSPLRLSKSRFTAGLQCHRQLWWKAHEPRAPELTPSAGLQVIFDTGHRVGERAHEEFPGATLIDVDYRRPNEAIEATRRAIADGALVILEASFMEDEIFVAVDALSKEGDGWVVTEVKSTASVKPQHVPDAAVQAHVVERAGLPVKRVELMHLNTRHRHPDEGPLFIRADITEAVNEHRVAIADQASAQMRMLRGALPVVAPGPHCTSPYECPFFGRCNEPRPEHSIEELHRISLEKCDELHDAGIDTVDQIPSDFPLSDLQKRHRASIRLNETIVEPGLRDALGAYRHPIAMLDFETIAPPLPIWEGCRPFRKVPVQFSVHILGEDGSVSHHGYLADGEGDPRPGVAQALVPALDGVGTVLAWNAQFEKECLRILAAASPACDAVLLEACDEVNDLLPVVRDHLYHPEFHGSFSIKSVVRALLPTMAYDELDIADGQAASFFLENLLCRPHEFSLGERAHLRTQLEAYCTHDTAVMVELLRYLWSAAKQ